jgi:hypothetical protein
MADQKIDIASDQKPTKKGRGDRRDGRWIRDIDGFHVVMMNLFPNRTEAEVYSKEQFDVTELLKLVEERNAADPDLQTKAFHVFVAAIAKTLWHRQTLNRFVAGRRMYQRHDLTFAFVVKRQFSDHAEELLLTMKVDGDTTLSDISRKILGETKEMRESGTSDVDGIINTFAKTPRFVQRIAMRAFRILDFYGMMPKFMTDGDTNYVSVLLSNLGSIKADAAYHHLNNYGTNSIMMTIGEIHKEQILSKEGLPVIRDVVNFGINVDERIADGFYFAKSMKIMRHIIEHPRMLEAPLKETIGYDGE